jgi:hypothetical protein
MLSLQSCEWLWGCIMGDIGKVVGERTVAPNVEDEGTVLKESLVRQVVATAVELWEMRWLKPRAYDSVSKQASRNRSFVHDGSGIKLYVSQTVTA